MLFGILFTRYYDYEVVKFSIKYFPRTISDNSEIITQTKIRLSIMVKIDFSKYEKFSYILNHSLLFSL